MDSLLIYTTEETKKVISKTHKGNTYRRGVKLSDETRRKISISQIGRVNSEESNKKRSTSMLEYRNRIRLEKEQEEKERHE